MGFRVWGIRFRFKGFELRASGLGFRVYPQTSSVISLAENALRAASGITYHLGSMVHG